jgi:Leucine-rich repeat (LRR) protein
LQGVQELNLGGRGLSLVPSELRFLSNLRELYLGNNQLTSIDPQTFANLINLEWLSLRANPITAAGPIFRGSLGLREGVALVL